VTGVSTDTRRRERYRFGPLEPGPVLGLHLSQVVALGAAALVLVAAANRPSTLQIAIGAAVSLLICIGALVPVAGGTAFGWAQLTGAHATRRLTGRSGYRHTCPPPGESCLPASLSGCRLVAIPSQGGEVGAIREGGLLTGVLEVRPTAFLLLDGAERERRVAGWGQILAGLASRGSVVSRVQWVERTADQPVDELGAWFTEHVRLEVTHPAVASYVALLQDAGPASVGHQILVAVSVDRRRAQHAIRRAGGGDLGHEVVLLRELEGLAAELSSHEIPVAGALTPRQLATHIRTGFDPTTTMTAAHRAAHHGPDGVTAADPGPMATEETWGTLRTDGFHHATFWIGEWPRLDVGCDVLAPLLLSDRMRRAVSVVMEPLDTARAIRGIERRAAAFDDDDHLRARGGWRQTGRRRRARQALDEQETELVAGHAPYRFSGYLTVTHADPAALEDECRQVTTLAARVHLDLRRMWGQQALAHTYTLPLARGLRSRGIG